MVYTVGIKRRFWFGYTKYRVTKHQTQFGMTTDIGSFTLGSPRLLLTLENGDTLAVAEILNRDFVIYADFELGRKKLEAERELDRIDAEARAADEEYHREYQHFKALQAEKQKIRAVEAPVVSKQA